CSCSYKVVQSAPGLLPHKSLLQPLYRSIILCWVAKVESWPLNALKSPLFLHNLFWSSFDVLTHIFLLCNRPPEHSQMRTCAHTHTHAHLTPASATHSCTHLHESPAPL